MGPFARFLVVVGAIGTVSTHAQQPCPAVSFQRAFSASLRTSSGLTHLTLVKQGDGSLTAYESADASPYNVKSVTPNYQTQLGGCRSLVSGTPDVQVAARLPDGGHLIAAASGSLYRQTTEYYPVTVAVFDANMNRVSEAQYNLNASGGVFVGDLNGDSFPDIIAIDGGQKLAASGSVYVLLGNVSSSLQALGPYTVHGGRPYEIAISDVNLDGKQDLIVVGRGGASLLLGYGDGTFQPVRILASVAYVAVAVADVNADGKPDLILTGQHSAVAVEFGNGDGTFGVPAEFPILDADSVAVGDVDGDGNLDIIVSGVTVLFGDGKGGFPRRNDYWGWRGNVILTDVDGDGKIDIVTGNGSPDALTGTSFSVMFNQGGGKFSGAPVTVVPAWHGDDVQYSGVLSADLDGDGALDLVVQEGKIAVLTGDGKGGFTGGLLEQTWSAASSATAVAVADFDGDGHPDLAVTTSGIAPNTSIPDQLAIFLGRGDGSFRPPALISSQPLQVAILAADFNKDGSPDLAVLTHADGTTGSDAVLIFLGDGKGGFAAPISTAVGPDPGAFGAGDFNGDGILDLAVLDVGFSEAQNSNVRVLLGKGDGTFSSAAPLPIGGSMNGGNQALAVADLNNDGKLDLAFPSSSYNLTVMLGRGDGTFISQPGPYLQWVLKLKALDINRDGILDLVRDGGVPVGTGYLLGNGDGTFQQPVGLGLSSPNGSAFGDFNGDGKLDIASLANPLGVATYLNNSPATRPAVSVSAAHYLLGPMAPESLASAFGESFAPGVFPGSLPLQTTLGGTTISIRDSTGIARVAPLLYVSPNQVNFQIPSGTAPGAATVNFFSLIYGTMYASAGNITIAPVTPGLFSADESGTGVAAALATLTSGGTQTVSAVFTCTSTPWACAPVPIDLGGPNDQATLILYGTGIRGRSALANVTCKVGSTPATVMYAGPHSVFPGVDEVDVVLPRSLVGAGLQNVALTVDTKVSNAVSISIR